MLSHSKILPIFSLNENLYLLSSGNALPYQTLKNNCPGLRIINHSVANYKHVLQTLQITVTLFNLPCLTKKHTDRCWIMLKVTSIFHTGQIHHTWPGLGKVPVTLLITKCTYMYIVLKHASQWPSNAIHSNYLVMLLSNL